MSEVFNIQHLNSLIEAQDIPSIKNYMEKHDLKLEGNKIVPKNKEENKKKIEFWDKRQYVRKIMLNS